MLWDGWQEDLIAEYAEGASHEEIKGLVVYECWQRGIDCQMSDSLWARWLKEDPEFSRTIKTGLHLSKLWWQRNGRKNLDNKEFSATLWYMNMKNRFGWSDKTETKTEHSGKIEIPGFGWANQ